MAYGRDLEAERERVERMTATMRLRGPDDGGVWIGGPAALGHRRLAVIDVGGGRQPMTSPDGQVVLSYSGEIYNFQELREQLRSHGHQFRTRSDTEVVLAAYLQWPEDFAARLNGMYAFAVWDARSQQLLLVRDRLGIKPLYYYPTADGLLFGSEPKAILANPLAEAVIDGDGLCELLTFAKMPGHATFRGMYEVRPGEIVHLRRGGLSRAAYWNLQAREHTADAAATATAVRELLEDVVARQLVSDVALGTLLSGGLDSSAITALAQRSLVSSRGEPVRSFTVDFTGYTENFTTDAFRATPDAPYAAECSRALGTDHRTVVLDSAQLVRPEVRRAVLRARDLPYGAGEMDISLHLLFRAVREHSTVVLSGEAADEVFGGYPWFHDSAAVNAGTFPWMAALGGSSSGGFVSPELTARLDLDGYAAQHYRDAVAEVPRLPGESAAQRRAREVCYLHLTRFVPILLDRKDRMSMATGLEVRVPFCDHRLVDYVFNVPWSIKSADGREKSLLRAAVADMLPASVAQRRKAPYPSTTDPAYARALAGQATTLLDAPAELIHVDAVRELLRRPPDAMTRAERVRLEAALALWTWVREYDVRVES
ncbi:asparagine synthase (glutamine-hydrolyzing) [Actinoplanes teichomyceticus]|uniref:asparagine synthase (glutamine-hydrolyzing) n=1 Tax=Actinoplanes teichomyceticus TaxID=1867 RepID=UPI001EF389EB|nr:asparagine synthase (glutamine-hydrolyzing) [Actinoplanes teichomyceticus]